ncbi:MAG: FHA domain-containing protein [Planctomycetota bacterium]
MPAETPQPNLPGHSTPIVRVFREHRLLAERELTSPLRIGRHPENELVLDDELVSGHHGRIEFARGGWVYTDLGSTNGSIVAAGPTLRKGQTHPLHEDSQILLGATVLEVRLGEGTALLSAALGTDTSTFPGGLPPAAPQRAEASSAAPSAPPHPARLWIVLGGAVRQATCAAPRCTLGRASDCDLVIEHPSVSAQHAEITWESGQWLLRDLGSTNGTRLGLRRVRTPAALRDHAHLILGDVDLLFVSGAERAAQARRSALCLKLLAEQGLLSAAQVREARAELGSASADSLSLGEVLVSRGWLSPGQWSEALAEAEAEPSTSRVLPSRRALLLLLLALLFAAILLALALR